MIRTEADADYATWLFQLNYDRLRGVSIDALSEHVQAFGGRSTGHTETKILSIN